MCVYKIKVGMNYRGRYLNYHYKITNLFLCICEHVHEGQRTITEISCFLPYGLWGSNSGH